VRNKQRQRYASETIKARSHRVYERNREAIIDRVRAWARIVAEAKGLAYRFRPSAMRQQ
jgi:hypothetical protein